MQGLVGLYLFFEAHLEGDMDCPQGACHLPHSCCKLIHLLIGKRPTATASLCITSSKQHTKLPTLGDWDGLYTECSLSKQQTSGVQFHP